jgi:hypothetical protein
MKLPLVDGMDQLSILLYLLPKGSRKSIPVYDTKEMRCLLLELEENNRVEGLRANKLIAEQFPNRKDIFNDTDKQLKVIERANEKIKAINNKFSDNTNSILLNIILCQIMLQ